MVLGPLRLLRLPPTNSRQHNKPVPASPAHTRIYLWYDRCPRHLEDKEYQLFWPNPTYTLHLGTLDSSSTCPEGPSTQYLRPLVPKTIPLLVFGAKLLRTFQGMFYGPLVWAPNLDPNIYQLSTIYKKGARRTDPTRVKGAHRKTLGYWTLLGRSPKKYGFLFPAASGALGAAARRRRPRGTVA